MRSAALPLLAGILGAVWVALLVPDPAYFLRDADGGFFIQGAYDWRVAGLVPQVDVHSSYGPLSYVARMVFQALLGDRIVAEVALAAVGYGVSYGLLFACFRGLSGSTTAASLLLGAALLALPRYYKFPVVLVPATAVWAALRLASGPIGAARAFAAGAVLGLAFLFRHDYFVFAAAVVGVAWARRALREPAVLRPLPIAVGTCVAVAAPWLAELESTRGLGSYLAELAGVTGSKVVGMGLPHPLLHPGRAGDSLLFASAYALPLIAALSLLRRTDAPAARDAAWIGAAAGLAFLPQSMHRADVGHLLQVVPGCLLALAGTRRRWAAAGAVSLAVMLGLLAATGRLAVPMARAEAPLGARLRAALLPATEVATHLEEGPWPIPRDAIRVLRTCAPEGTAVAVYPFAPQLAYFAGRVQGGAYLVLAPGYFDDEASLAQAFEQLRRDRVGLVLWDESFVFDGRPERRSVLTHAALRRQIGEHFVRLGDVDGFTVYADPALTRPESFVAQEGRCR